MDARLNESAEHSANQEFSEADKLFSQLLMGFRMIKVV
jgi:hypothetical protein